jgi:hypothetical protein
MALELLKGHSGLMRRATLQKTTHVQCRLSEDYKSLEFSVLEKPQSIESFDNKLKIQEIGTCFFFFFFSLPFLSRFSLVTFADILLQVVIRVC